MSIRIVSEQIIWVTLSRILSRGSLVATSIILARVLSIENFAAFSYFIITVSMLAAYASVGLGVAANRYFVGAEDINEQQAQTIASMVSISLFFTLAFTITVLLIPEKTLLGGLSLPKWAIVLGVFTYSLEVIPQNALNGLERYRQEAILSIFSGGFIIGMAFYAAQLGSMELALIALIGGSIIRVLGGSLLVGHIIGWQKIISGFPFSKKDALQIFNFSLPMFLVSLVFSTGPWAVGRIILDGTGGNHALAYYAIGLQWFSLGMFLPASIARITMPKMVKSIDKPDIGNPPKTHLILGLKLSVFSSSITVILGLMFNEHIIALYGDNYGVDWFFSAFLCISILAASSQILGMLIIVSNHQWDWLKLNLCFLATMMVVALALQNSGVWAGVAAFLFGYLSLIILSILVIKKYNLLATPKVL